MEVNILNLQIPSRLRAFA